MATNFPGSVDDASTVGDDTHPSADELLSSTDGGPAHHALHQNVGLAINAIEDKVGTGASTPVVGSVLTGTGSGTSAWSNAPLYVDTANNKVAINATSFGAEFEVHGSSNPELRIRSTDASNPALVFGDAVDGARASIFYDTSEDRLHFRGYDNTNRMVIDSSGRIGIGTTSPAEELHIRKNQDGVLTQMMIENIDQRVRLGSYYEAGVGQYAKIQSENDAGGNLALALNPEGGNVGIGTESPSYKLEVDGDVGIDNGQLVLGSWDSGNTDIDGILPGTAFGALVQGQTSGHLTLAIRENDNSDAFSVISGGGNYSTDSTFDTVVLYAQANGNVGIGTASPIWPLDVNGTARIIGNINSIGTYNTTNGGAANMVILSNGFFYRSTSSLKYKTDVETMQDEYADAILGLRPVWFRSLSESDPDSWGYWGFIAEEVAEVDPRLVHFGVPDDYEWQYDEDGQQIDADVADLTEPEGVQYDRMVPHLVNLLARQRDQIADLSTRVATLEAA